MSVLALVLSLSFSACLTLCDEVNLENKIRELEHIVKEQHEENAALEHRANQLEETLEKLERLKCETENNNNSTFGISREESQLTEVLNYKEKRQVQGHQAAFHAYLTNTKCFYVQQNIKFDTEVVDEPMHDSTRGGYYPNEGVFDAPIAGVYVFTWTATAPKTKERFVTDLIVDGTAVTSTTSDPDYVTGAAGNGVHPSTGVYVTYINEGVHVHVKIRREDGTGGCIFVKSDVQVRATFSGWLLF